MLTDPDQFQHSEEHQAAADEISQPSWFRLACDFRIDKWAVHTDEQLVMQNDALLAMQARGEVWYVEEFLAVYFFAGTHEEVMQRFDEYWDDLREQIRQARAA